MELFASSLLLRFTDPILERLVSKLWVEDVGVLHKIPNSDSKKIENKNLIQNNFIKILMSCSVAVDTCTFNFWV